MCGIVGYMGDKNAYAILINGLKRLEYRGYDSAGVALIDGGALNIYKCQGKVSDLESHVKNKNLRGTIGMGHTRWATHGQPNDINAHYPFAVALQKSRHPADAVAELEQMASLQPADASSHFGAALLCANDLQEPERARAHYERVLALEPAHPQAAAIRRWLASQAGK